VSTHRATVEKPVRRGTLVQFGSTGTPIVTIPRNFDRQNVVARSCEGLQSDDVGRDVVFVLGADERDDPIVLAVIQPQSGISTVDVTADGKSVSMGARESLTVRCGDDASITLHGFGKFVIRGQNVVSHAAGVNPIRAGAVQLNCLSPTLANILP